MAAYMKEMYLFLTSSVTWGSGWLELANVLLRDVGTQTNRENHGTKTALSIA